MGGFGWTCPGCHEPLPCRICEQYGHDTVDCRFLYAACRKPNCEGYRRVWKSTTAENPGRLFLKCVDASCKDFQWVDEAVSSSSSPRQHYPKGCFDCGSPDHWKRDCPSTPSSSKSTGKKVGHDNSHPAKLVIETTLEELVEQIQSGFKINK